MADEKKPDPKVATPGAKKTPKSGKLRFFTFMILFGMSVPFLMPTLTLILIGTIPTLISLLTDNDRDKSSTAAIGAMNCAGLTPFIIDLWMKGQSMENVFAILKEPSNWLIMLGAAAIGKLIIFAVPHAMTSLTLARAEARLKILKQNLDQLKITWGPEVATNKPIEKILQSE